MAKVKYKPLKVKFKVEKGETKTVRFAGSGRIKTKINDAPNKFHRVEAGEVYVVASATSETKISKQEFVTNVDGIQIRRLVAVVDSVAAKGKVTISNDDDPDG